jgi:hypothetical protein
VSDGNQAFPAQRIFTHIGEPIPLARGPPATWNDSLDVLPDWDAMTHPEPGYLFDQRVGW